MKPAVFAMTSTKETGYSIPTLNILLKVLSIDASLNLYINTSELKRNRQHQKSKENKSAELIGLIGKNGLIDDRDGKNN